MSYDSILVHLEFSGNPAMRLQYAADLAGDLDAFLIGFTATAVPPVHASELGVLADDAYSEALVQHNHERFDEIRRHFFEIAGGGHNSGWRESDDIPTRALLQAARTADLIVTGTPHGIAPGDIYRSIDPGVVVCDAGRPVLFIAENGVYRHPKCALIGWKDTPEARRAIAFALPFLQLAEHTVVLTMQEKDDTAETGLDDVVRYLKRHGVDSDAKTISDKSGPDGFLEAVHVEGADLVVSGAYGHSRLRERIFGGFTRTLLMQNDLNRLMTG